MVLGDRVTAVHKDHSGRAERKLCCLGRLLDCVLYIAFYEIDSLLIFQVHSKCLDCWMALVYWEIKYSPACFTCADIVYSLKVFNFVTAVGTLLQSKYCHVATLIDILQHVLYAFKACTPQLNVYMGIEVAAEILIVWDFPAVVSLNFIIVAIAFHSHLSCTATIIGLLPSI